MIKMDDIIDDTAFSLHEKETKISRIWAPPSCADEPECTVLMRWCCYRVEFLHIYPDDSIIRRPHLSIVMFPALFHSFKLQIKTDKLEQTSAWQILPQMKKIWWLVIVVCPISHRLTWRGWDLWSILQIATREYLRCFGFKAVQHADVGFLKSYFSVIVLIGWDSADRHKISDEGYMRWLIPDLSLSLRLPWAIN